ncbi:galactose-3-O-sulfotransferase 4-like [Littorina saxatilis]
MSDYVIQMDTIVRTFNPSLTQKRDFKTTLPNSKVDSGNQKAYNRNIHEMKRYSNTTSSNGVHVAEHDTNIKSGQNSGGKLNTVPGVFIDRKPEAYLGNDQALAGALINNRNAHGVAKFELKPQSYHTQSPSKPPAYRGNLYPDIDVDEYRQAELGTFRHSGGVFRQPGPSDIDHVDFQARESGAHHFRKGDRDERLPSHRRHYDYGRMKPPGLDQHMRGREQMHRPWELHKKTQAQQDTDKDLVSLMGARWRGERRETQNTKGEQRHVFFLKVHKAASTTVMNVLYRFALQRNLNVALPMRDNILSENGKLWARRLLPPPTGASYFFDILCNHLVFHEPSVRVTLPADASFIGIVREPFQQFVSAFQYYRTNFNIKYLEQIHSSDPIATYLHDPAQYEPTRGPSFSYTHNRMSFDFGIDPEKMNSERHIKDYVSYLNRTFQLVMVSERFDESMVLLKRLLGWRLQDVLYIKNNVLKGSAGGGGDSQFTAGQRQAHRHFNAADYALYEHFAQLFQAKVEAEGKLFPQEVAAFVTMREKVEAFCAGAANTSNEGEHLTLVATAWTGVFEVTKKECRLMTLQENRFVDLVRQWQYGPLLMEKYQLMMSKHRRERLFIPPKVARFDQRFNRHG